MTIIFAIHGLDYVDFDVYIDHLALMVALSKEHNIRLVRIRNTKVAQARNAVVKEIRKLEGDYVCFLDTDHRVSPNMITLLLQNMQFAKVASGLVCRRRGPKDPIGYLQRDDGMFLKATLARGMGSVFVDTCAFGCTLIDRDFLCSFDDPVFVDSTRKGENGKVIQLRSDINFCLAVRDKGEKIVVDTRVIVGHVSEPSVVWPDKVQTESSSVELSKPGDGLRPGQPATSDI